MYCILGPQRPGPGRGQPPSADTACIKTVTFHTNKEERIDSMQDTFSTAKTYTGPHKNLDWAAYQDRRQKVFNRGLCSSAKRLFVCAGGLDIIKLTKTPLIYSVSRFSFGGLELCLAGLSPPKPPPVATGLLHAARRLLVRHSCLGLDLLTFITSLIYKMLLI